MNIRKIITIFFLILINISALKAQDLSDAMKMHFMLDGNGKVTLSFLGKQYIEPSNIGLIVKDSQIYEPMSVKETNGSIAVRYDNSSWVTLDKKEREDGSVRLEVLSCSNDIDAFIFGPYVCPETKEVGELVGAAWHEDGSSVCIQALNPKTQGECYIQSDKVPYNPGFLNVVYKNNPSFTIPCMNVAGKSSDGKYVLSCKVVNMQKPFIVPQTVTGMKNVLIDPLSAPEGNIEGAAIILTCASDADDLLSRISKIEIEEGLPHPMIGDQWAKVSPHTNDIYLVFESGDIDTQIASAKRAGVNWIYFNNPFKSWGHFEINEDMYPGGEKQFAETIKKAHDNDINIGFHTLSNFIHSYDPYVSPVPSSELLSFDDTKITRSISEDDSVIYIKEALNYDVKQNLSSVRIGNEIIRFGKFDKENLCLVSCNRGAFGTTASSHRKGETITHLVDNGYGTFFPSIKLQNEMADRIGTLIRDNDIRRMSFDGLEGCRCTEYGRYADASFIERIYKIAGRNLISDASQGFHYSWHANSYYNWGEPWYDYKRRGGMYNYRASNLNKFKRNLLPGMLGWYCIFNSDGRREATSPDAMEYMVSRTIAFNAGLCFQIGVPATDRLNEYFDIINLWQKFKYEVNVSDSIRDLMKDERSDWHLEKKDEKWQLSELFVTDYDMTYCDRFVMTESRNTGYMASDESLKQSAHRANIVIDRSSYDNRIPFISEPFHCRIRVGTPQDHGKIHNVSFSPGWYGAKILLSFDVTANAGEYLEYKGGTTLYRYDKDFNLIEKVEGKGHELVVDGSTLCGFTINYDIVDELPGQQPLVPMLKYFRTKQVFIF